MLRRLVSALKTKFLSAFSSPYISSGSLLIVVASDVIFLANRSLAPKPWSIYAA